MSLAAVLAAYLALSPNGVWELNDTTTTAVDSSGTSHPGTYSGSYTQQQIGPYPQTDLTLATAFSQSSNAVVKIPIGNSGATAFNPGNTSFTINMWIKQAYADSVSGQSSQQLFSAYDGTNQYQFCSNSGALRFYSSQLNYALQPGATVNDGLWHMVSLVVVPSTGQSTLYKDGVSVGTVTGGANSVTLNNTANVGIAAYGDLTGYSFKGVIAMVAYFPSALTQPQLAAFVTAMAAAPTNPATVKNFTVIGSGDFTMPAHTGNIRLVLTGAGDSNGTSGGGGGECLAATVSLVAGRVYSVNVDSGGDEAATTIYDPTLSQNVAIANSGSAGNGAAASGALTGGYGVISANYGGGNGGAAGGTAGGGGGGTGTTIGAGANGSNGSGTTGGAGGLDGSGNASGGAGGNAAANGHDATGSGGGSGGKGTGGSNPGTPADGYVQIIYMPASAASSSVSGQVGYQVGSQIGYQVRSQVRG